MRERTIDSGCSQGLISLAKNENESRHIHKRVLSHKISERFTPFQEYFGEREREQASQRKSGWAREIALARKRARTRVIMTIIDHANTCSTHTHTFVHACRCGHIHTHMHIKVHARTHTHNVRAHTRSHADIQTRSYPQFVHTNTLTRTCVCT